MKPRGRLGCEVVVGNGDQAGSYPDWTGDRLHGHTQLVWGVNRSSSTEAAERSAVIRSSGLYISETWCARSESMCELDLQAEPAWFVKSTKIETSNTRTKEPEPCCTKRCSKLTECSQEGEDDMGSRKHKEGQQQPESLHSTQTTLV